jgi:pimeloyl-ACP methyl ester carboxylesterase
MKRLGTPLFLRRLSAFARVITFDKRGQGLSDRISGAPSLEERMDDVRAVMDAVGSERAAVWGFSEGCTMSALFAATYPERVSKLILFGGFAEAATVESDWEERIARRVQVWGTGDLIKILWPSRAMNQDAINLIAKFERLSASPGAVKAIMLLNAQINVRPILPTVQVPTLVLHRRGDAMVPGRARSQFGDTNSKRKIHRISGRRSFLFFWRS